MRWTIWSMYVLLLSTILLTPQPAHVAQAVFSAEDTRFTAVKMFHLMAYVGLAILSGWLRVPMTRRPLLLFVLSLHACGTEFFQQFIPARAGCWQDAALNHVGLYFGLLLSWKWWMAADRKVTAHEA